MAAIKYSLLSFPLASVGLGIWQLKRLEWKLGLIKNLEDQLKDEPIDISEVLSTENLKDLEYRRIKARGSFDQDPSHQLYLSPRQLIVNNEALFRGRTAHQSNVGVDVVTPFKLEGSDKRIIVNRGWLASKGTRDAVSTSSQLGMGENGELKDLVGILRISDDRPTYGIKNNESTNEWQVRNVEAIARKLKTEPVFIDADQSLSTGIGPIGGQTQLNIRNEHLNYAITWFGLAIFSYLMWHTKFGRKKATYRHTLFKSPGKV